MMMGFQATNESTLGKDLLVLLVHHDLNDPWSLILIQFIPKGRNHCISSWHGKLFAKDLLATNSIHIFLGRSELCKNLSGSFHVIIYWTRMSTPQETRYVLFLPFSIKKNHFTKEKDCWSPSRSSQRKTPTNKWNACQERRKKLPGREDLPIADRSCHEKEVFAER